MTEDEKGWPRTQALEKRRDFLGENDRRTQAWQIQLNNAEAALNGMERELEQNNDALDKAGDELNDAGKHADDFGDEVEDAGKQSDDAGGRFDKLGAVCKPLPPRLPPRLSLCPQPPLPLGRRS